MNKSEIIECIKNESLKFEDLEEIYKNDKEIVLAAVQQDGSALEFASDELKNNKEIVLETVKQNGYALWFASDELKNDKNIVLEAVKENGDALRYASDELQNDKEIVLAAIQQNGHALKYISDKLKNDKEIVLEAVIQNGKALGFASDELKNDKEIVLAAVKQNGYALYYAFEKLQNNKKIVLAAVQQNGSALYYASDELQNDKKIVLTAIKNNKESLKYASNKFKLNKEIIKEMNYNFCLNIYYYSLSYINNIFKEKNKNKILLKIKKNVYALECASYELQNDKENLLIENNDNFKNKVIKYSNKLNFNKIFKENEDEQIEKILNNIKLRIINLLKEKINTIYYKKPYKNYLNKFINSDINALEILLSLLIVKKAIENKSEILKLTSNEIKKLLELNTNEKIIEIVKNKGYVDYIDLVNYYINKKDYLNNFQKDYNLELENNNIFTKML